MSLESVEESGAASLSDSSDNTLTVQRCRAHWSDWVVHVEMHGVFSVVVDGKRF